MASLSSVTSPGEAEIEHIGCRIIGTHREGRTVWFTFELTFKALYWTLDLRYSQLFSLYKEIAAKDELPTAATVVFPPKKIANTNPAFIETRRSMLEAWVAAVLRTNESFGNAELLELIMVPVTAMVWVRKYHRMTASDRSANRVEQGGMLWVDMQYAQAPGKADARLSDDLLMALADPSAQTGLAAIAKASIPSAFHYAKAKVCETLTSSILTEKIDYARPAPFFAEDTANTVLGLHKIWFDATGPVVDTAALPAFIPGKSPRKRMTRRQSTRRVNILPPAVYTVEITRSRDARGVLIPFQVNLAKETGGEYCWLSSVGSNDALSKAGLLAGDNLLALGRQSFFQASQQAVLGALLEAPETFSLCLSRALEIHAINIGKFIRTSNEPLPMGATLVSDEDLHVGEIVHKFRKVHPEGAGARAGVKANDILLEVDGTSTKKFSHKELKQWLQKTTADMFLVARAKPPTRLAHETPKKADQMVKLGASDVISEGFMCPLCMKDLGTMENLASHFEDEHADPSHEADQTSSPVTHSPTPATPAAKQSQSQPQQRRQTSSERHAQHRGPKKGRRQHDKQPDFRSPQVAVNPAIARLMAQPQRARANSASTSSRGAAPSFHDVNRSPVVAPAPPATKVPPVELVRFCRFCGMPFVGWNNAQKQDHLANCTRAQGSPNAGPPAALPRSASRQLPPQPAGGQWGQPSPHLARQPRQFDAPGGQHFEQDFGKVAAPVQRMRGLSFRSSPKNSPRTAPKVPKPGAAQAQPQGLAQDRWWVARKAEKTVLKEVAAAQCGDFLVRQQGSSPSRVLIAMNDFGVARSLLVLIQPDGQAQMAGRDTPLHPSLYHLIDALRHTPQRSSTHVGSAFQLRLPAGRLGQLHQSAMTS